MAKRRLKKIENLSLRKVIPITGKVLLPRKKSGLTQTPAPSGLRITVLEPTYPVASKITKEDVFGRWVDGVKVHAGMVVARYEDACPIFGDAVPYKSVTVVCEASLGEEVSYWLEYVHGADCISEVNILDDGRLAMRSDYMAW